MIVLFDGICFISFVFIYIVTFSAPIDQLFFASSMFFCVQQWHDVYKLLPLSTLPSFSIISFFSK